jgi:hypothetical protein
MNIRMIGEAYQSNNRAIIPWKFCQDPGLLLSILAFPMLAQLSPSFIILGGSAAASALVAYAYLTYRRNLRAVGETPGLRTCVSVIRPIMMVLPVGKIPYSNWYFSIGPDAWANRHHDSEPCKSIRCTDLQILVFREYGQDVISAVSRHLFD